MKSLKTFPEGFMPLVIITGDRRESPPTCKGDMLAYSVSTTDVMYLTHLHLQDCPILSDKQFVIDPEDVLRKRFGSTNLLVIGSPAVNLLARRINNQSMFRFAISEDTQMQLKEQTQFMDAFIEFEDDFFIYQQCLAGILDISNIVSRYVGLDPHIDNLRERARKIVPAFRRTRICHDLQTHPRPIRYLLHQLDKPGIYDSLAHSTRGEAIGAYKDYGLISILANPFSSGTEYSIVYVAGVHGPGTAQGLRLLADRGSCEGHPFGGIYEVNISRFVSYFEKIQKSPPPRWETRAYVESDYDTAKERSLRTVKAFLSSPGKKEDEEQKAFNGRLIQLLQDACAAKGLALQMEQPYTIPLTGGLDFWQVILNWEKECRFVVHDMTNFARGVMVEIGFSYGTKRQHFLIWNLKHGLMNLKSANHPSLLPVENVEAVDLSDAQTVSGTLDRMVVSKVLPPAADFECSQCRPPVKPPDRKICFVYSTEPTLKRFLDGELHERNIYSIREDESKKTLRICKICQVLRVSDVSIIELADHDLDSFIVLGMAKALGIRTLPLALARYDRSDFPWAQDMIEYQIENLAELKSHLSGFMQYAADTKRPK